MKSTPRSQWSGGSFEHRFILFRARETQLYEKAPPWSFLFSCLFKLSKHEKTLSSSFVRLVKIKWYRAPSKRRPPSTCYPRQACHPKIIGVLARNGGGNKGTVIVVIGSMSLLNMALFAFVSGWGHLISLHFCLHGFGLSYLANHLLIVLSLWPLIIWPPNTTKSVIVPPICSREVDLCKYNPPLIFHAKTNLSLPVSHRWCGKHYGPPSIKITSCRLQLIIQEWPRDSLQVHWSLHASMAGSSCSTRGFHHWPPIEWFCGCSTSTHSFTYRGLYL